MQRLQLVAKYGLSPRKLTALKEEIVYQYMDAVGNCITLIDFSTKYYFSRDNKKSVVYDNYQDQQTFMENYNNFMKEVD